MRKLKSAKIQISMTDAEREKLIALAAVNTEGNMSFLIRAIIDKACENPGQFGLRPPTPSLKK